MTRTRPAQFIGGSSADLPTPALLIDYAALRRNVGRMGRSPAGGSRLRPHVKAHKCAEIAALQRGAGANGFTCATVWEAAFLARHGFDRILVANAVVGDAKITALAAIASGGTDVTVAVDDASNAAALSGAAAANNCVFGVLIDIDTGMRRCGVRSAAAAIELAIDISRLPGLDLRGVSGYEGHCVLEPDRGVRATKADAAMEELTDFVRALREAGFAVPTVSAGGTGTWDISGVDARVTELQAGSYVFMDATRGAYVPDFEHALTVLCSVVSTQGGSVIVDGGRKTIGAEFTLPKARDASALIARGIAEEHVLFDAPGDAHNLRVGDRLELIPGYAPTTTNLHPFYFVIEEGLVADVWEIGARGAGVSEWRSLL